MIHVLIGQKRSNRKTVGENICLQAVKTLLFFFRSSFPSLKHTQINTRKTAFTVTQTPTNMQRKHQFTPVLFAEKHARFVSNTRLWHMMSHVQVCIYHIPHNMLLSYLSRCRRGQFFGDISRAVQTGLVLHLSV